jgi:hypothetical protein
MLIRLCKIFLNKSTLLKMTQNLIIVGAGDYYNNLVSPALAKLRESNLVSTVTTVDLEDKVSAEGTSHIIRKPDQPIADLVDSLGYDSPTVILSHANELHAPEASELLGATCQPKILIEKPYAINGKDLAVFKDLIEKGNNRVGVLEYYLQMKGVPLLVFGGTVKADSFYFEGNGILKAHDKDLEEYFGRMTEFIGKPLFVVSDILEGAGSYGTIAHRNVSLVDRSLGGGMIQDLGHHAVTTLMGLEDILGTITADSLRAVRMGVCEEYFSSALNRGVPAEQIGESYAEIDLETGTGIPVRVSLGKYIENGNNQRRIVIVGTKGVVTYDMTNNILAFQQGDSAVASDPLLEADKVGVPKYLAVLQAGLEGVQGRNPFTFDPNEVGYNAQQLVLHAITMAAHNKMRTYAQGEMHDKIFE